MVPSSSVLAFPLKSWQGILIVDMTNMYLFLFFLKKNRDDMIYVNNHMLCCDFRGKVNIIGAKNSWSKKMCTFYLEHPVYLES